MRLREAARDGVENAMVDFGFNSPREREGSDKYLIRASSLTGLEGAPPVRDWSIGRTVGRQTR